MIPHKIYRIYLYLEYSEWVAFDTYHFIDYYRYYYFLSNSLLESILHVHRNKKLFSELLVRLLKTIIFFSILSIFESSDNPIYNFRNVTHLIKSMTKVYFKSDNAEVCSYF